MQLFTIVQNSSSLNKAATIGSSNKNYHKIIPSRPAMPLNKSNIKMYSNSCSGNFTVNNISVSKLESQKMDHGNLAEILSMNAPS